MRAHVFIVPALALLGLISGCQASERAVENRYETLSGEFEAQLNAQTDATPLDWNEAVERMMAQNLDIQRSYNGILDAREATQRVFLDLVPPVNLSARLSRQLTDFSNLSSDNLDFSIASTVNVPGILRLRVNHYAALLQEIRATWAFELERRERTAQL